MRNGHALEEAGIGVNARGAFGKSLRLHTLLLAAPRAFRLVLSIMFRDDSVNSALLMVLVCGLEGAELLRCHAIARRAENYFCAVMVAVAAAPEPTAFCSLSGV